MSPFGVVVSSSTYFLTTGVALDPIAHSVSSAASGVDYFPWEKSQLTRAGIANLSASTNATFASLFDFATAENGTNLEENLQQRSCKLMPGDSAWPSESTWDAFDALLGDKALIKAIPAAAVCYPSWPEYDETACTALDEVWEDPTWQ